MLAREEAERHIAPVWSRSHGWRARELRVTLRSHIKDISFLHSMAEIYQSPSTSLAMNDPFCSSVVECCEALCPGRTSATGCGSKRTRDDRGLQLRALLRDGLSSYVSDFLLARLCGVDLRHFLW